MDDSSNTESDFADGEPSAEDNNDIQPDEADEPVEEESPAEEAKILKQLENKLTFGQYGAGTPIAEMVPTLK